MKLRIAALCALVICSVGAMAKDLSGDWTGKLDLGAQGALRIVFHISAQDRTVEMDSPDQNARGIKGVMEFLSEDSISFRVPQLMMSYRGALKGDSLKGTFLQRFNRLPLNLARGEMKA